MNSCFAKTDPGIQHHLRSINAERVQSFQTFLEKCFYLGTHIVVFWPILHCLRSALHVHQNVTCSSIRDYTPHSVVFPIGSDVVDGDCSGRNCGFGNSGFLGVNGNWHIRLCH